jgi:hypothetical protein
VRECLGCGRLIPGGSRCAACQRQADARRYSEPERVARKRLRYTAEYNAVRAQWQKAVAAGAMPPCSRCGNPVRPADEMDLDHAPDGSLKPSHARCNRAAGARDSNRRRRAARQEETYL